MRRTVIATLLVACSQHGEDAYVPRAAEPTVDPASDAGQETATSSPDAATDDAPFGTPDPAVPPVSCSARPTLRSKRDLGNADLVSIQPLDERRAIVMWRWKNLTRASVVDVTTDAAGPIFELDEGVAANLLAPGVVELRDPDYTATSMRVFAAGRLSAQLPGQTALVAKDGRILVLGAKEMHWYDPMTGTLGEAIPMPVERYDYRLLDDGTFVMIGGDKIAVYKAGAWTTETISGSAFVGQHDVVVVAPPKTYATGPVTARRLRLSALEAGFEPEVVLSTTAEGDGVTAGGAYGSKPNWTVLTDGDHLRYVGAVATCATCAVSVVERVLEDGGWSAPTTLDLAPSKLEDISFRGGLMFDSAHGRAALPRATGWRVFDLALSGGGTWVSFRTGDHLYFDASTGEGHQVGYLDVTGDAPTPAWMKLATGAFIGIPMHGYNYWFLGAADVNGGFFSSPPHPSTTLVRIKPGPAIVDWQTFDVDAQSAGTSSASHAVLHVTQRAKDTNHFVARVDAWNDVGGADPYVVDTESWNPYASVSVAAMRCGGLLAFVRPEDHTATLVRLGGE